MVQVFENGHTEIISKIRYKIRLNNATIASQSSYSQYRIESGAGFPGYEASSNPISFYPDINYQNGYVCYSLIARARQDAGINENIPSSVAELIGNRQILRQDEIDGGLVYPGDIIAYDFDPNKPGYEHVGIISDTTGSPENWKVISSIGIIEHFRYGVLEHRLEIFGSEPRGDFSSWNPDYQNYTWSIFVGS